MTEVKEISVPDEPTLIAYYCRHCDKVVQGKSKGSRKKYSFSCPDCQGDCLYGTVRSIIHYFRIKEHSDNAKILLEMQGEKLKALEEKVQEIV